MSLAEVGIWIYFPIVGAYITSQMDDEGREGSLEDLIVQKGASGGRDRMEDRRWLQRFAEFPLSMVEHVSMAQARRTDDEKSLYMSEWRYSI